MMNYFRMKRNEWKIKTMLYGAILSVIEDQRGTLTLINKLCAALKDVPEEELKNEVAQKLAEIIHSEHQES
ncbi:MAG: hypothetical protein K2I07_12720 [Lachnospiraceae bacterium]|nr:hypothetical protein [Lachnospiraceae bacterium]